ncbi:WD40-repeat-containing domain protein [Ochromonadaceae sp. CCMP2298]|nr:WD40-repeat-containing domain protein [Ochromonadaceae sp. CCMP2298]
MERVGLSMSPERALYLGSKDRVLVTGNCPGSNTANLQVHFQGDSSGNVKPKKMADLYVEGYCRSMELCQDLGSAKTFAAVALSNAPSSSGSGGSNAITLCDVTTTPDAASLSLGGGGDGVVYRGPGEVGCLAFSGELELLALGCDSGHVVVLDLRSGREVATLRADACGVGALLFRGGQLVSAGTGPQSPVKIWDLRARPGAEGGASLSLSQQLGEGGGGGGGAAGLSSGSGAVTALCAHPVHGDRLLASGCVGGSVQLWDLRSGACRSFQPHSRRSTVTGLLVHPRRLDSLVSCATDGAVCCFSTTAAEGDAMEEEGEGQGQGRYPVLYREPSANRPRAPVASVCSVDCDNSSDQCMLLASSSAGAYMRLAI